MLGTAGPRELRWARTRWPSTTMADLHHGREAFVEHCGGCHALPQPEAFPPGRWTALMTDMAEEAQLGPAARDQILRFVASMSATRP